MDRSRMHRGHATALAVMVTVCIGLLSTGCTTPKLLADRAERQMARGELIEAEKTLNRAEEMHPAAWRTQYMMGRLRLEQDRPHEAETALKRALSLRPSHEETEDILDLIAEALYQQGDDSERGLRRFLDRQVRDRGSARDYARKGLYLARLGDPDAGIVALRQSMALDPVGDAYSHKAMAELYRIIGDRRRELRSLRHAFFLDPDDQEVRDRMKELGHEPGPTAGLAPPLLR